MTERKTKINLYIYIRDSGRSGGGVVQLPGVGRVAGVFNGNFPRPCGVGKPVVNPAEGLE